MTVRPDLNVTLKLHLGKLHDAHDKEFVYKATIQNEPNPLIDNKFSGLRIQPGSTPFSLATPQNAPQESQPQKLGRNSLGDVRRPTPYDRIEVQPPKPTTMIIDTTKQELEQDTVTVRQENFQNYDVILRFLLVFMASSATIFCFMTSL